MDLNRKTLRRADIAVRASDCVNIRCAVKESCEQSINCLLPVHACDAIAHEALMSQVL